MARVFRGEGLHKVDAKGRVSIPALFRRVLEAGDPDWTEGLTPNMVIVYGDHRRKYLECYTMEAMDEVDRQIARMPRGSLDRRVMVDTPRELSRARRASIARTDVRWGNGASDDCQPEVMST